MTRRRDRQAPMVATTGESHDPRAGVGEQCPICDGSMNLVRQRRPVAVGARSAEVEDEFLRCSECGEELYLPGQMDAAQMRASAAIREAEGLLQPDEIRALRQSLGLSQTALERLIGAGPKTVVRWEKGTVFQQATADTLLRLLRADHRIAGVLGRMKGVAVREQHGEHPLEGLPPLAGEGNLPRVLYGPIEWVESRNDPEGGASASTWSNVRHVAEPTIPWPVRAGSRGMN